MSHRKKETLQLSESITLDVVDCVKLLGVDIHKKLELSSHIARVCNKAGKDCYVLRRLSNFLTPESKLMLFKCYIVARFSFCSGFTLLFTLLWLSVVHQNTAFKIRSF